ncbi:MAG: helix-turn-helix transcriptional regulator, partial [Pseudomonadota bacterium]
MPVKLAHSTKVKGRDLRFLRKRQFTSADAFAAACGSVSTPTVYRAERGGPILTSYLATMARALGVDVERLIAEDATDDATAAPRDLTGSWVGYYIGMDRFGQPYLIEEATDLVQTGNAVEGHAVIETREGIMRDLFVDCFFTGNVFSGQTKSAQWPFPLDCAAFVTSGVRTFARLDGYISWYDLDTERPEFSRYALIRRDAPQFETETAAAHAMFEDEIKLMRVRRLLESGYSFENSVELLAAGEDAPPLRRDEPAAGHQADNVAADKAEPVAPTGRINVAVSALVVLDPDPTQKFYADGLI